MELGPAYGKAVIARVIDRSREKFRSCYELYPGDASDGAYRVEFGFTIGSDGAEVNALADAADNQALHCCIVAAMMSLRFPKPPGGGIVIVRYPWL